jgi:hypothetical protein
VTPVPRVKCVERNAGRLRLTIAVDDDSPELEGLLSISLPQLRERPGVTVLRDREQAWVLRIERPGRPALYWKEFGARDVFDDFKEFWRPSKAARAWDGAERLMEIGTRTARLVARGEAPRGSPFRHRRSFLVTEEIVGAVSLSHVLWHVPERDSGPSACWKHDLMRLMGRTVGRMHNAGVYHGDLRPGNTLCRKGENGPEIFLIDTDRILPKRLPGLRDAVHNLMQVSFFFAPNFTFTDRLRFLDAYARERGFDRVNRRRLIAWTADWVYRRTRRRLNRKTKAGQRKNLLSHMQRLLDRMESRRVEQR